jgi:hypothetical protein
MRAFVLFIVVVSVGVVHAGPPCVSGDDQWSGTIGGHSVRCCTRHGLGGTGTYDFDGVMLWCPHSGHPSIYVRGMLDPLSLQPFLFGGTACRIGPRLRHPPALKQPLRRQRGCCAISGGIEAEVLADGRERISAIHGDASCRLIIPINLQRDERRIP